MKTLIFVLLGFFSIGCSAQSTKKLESDFKKTGALSDTAFDAGSIIKIPELNERLINDLELLGRIWGFLKYHHPEIAKGNYNWDYELFRILPEYLSNQNNSERDKILVNWINRYGNITTCSNCDSTATFFHTNT